MGMKIPDMRFKYIYDALEHLNISHYIVMEEGCWVARKVKTSESDQDSSSLDKL